MPNVGPAPPARTTDVVDVLHGVEVPDPYRWLEDGEAAETQQWTAAQNERTRSVLDALPNRAGIHRRLTGLLRAGSSVGPRVAGDRIFSLDRWSDHDQAVIVVRPVDEPGPVEPRVVLDPHAATGDPTAAIDWFHPSRDGRLLAYGISSGGDEHSTLKIVDVDRGEHLPDEIPDTRAASVAWWPEADGFAYARYPSGEEYGRHLRLHRLGDDPADDKVLFEARSEPEAWPDVSLSRDGRWYAVHVAYGWTRIDVHLVERATGEATTIIEGTEAISFVEAVGDRIIGVTTLDADRGRVIAAPVATPTPDHWQTLVPETDAVIEGVTITPAAMLVASTVRAASRLDRYDQGGGDRAPIELPELGSLAGLSASKQAELAAFSFTGFTRPATTFRWTPESGVEQWSALPRAPDGDRYQVEQVTYPSTDGTEIGMFLISEARTGSGSATSPRATILTGYGGFGVTMSPAWSPLIAAHCDDGGLYAVACIRGGAEDGEAWHKAGMRQHKQQVFDDFGAAADWLVASGRTTRDRLAIRGGSNGGLLMGAIVTQRPDLAGAVHCAVPLLDMVRFHYFRIAKLWIPEYGDPDVAEEFAWLYAYSPYHRVADGTCYPAMLITTAEEDSRVDPNHARKFAARIQAATSCGEQRPILLRVETRAGHGQGKPVSKQAEELADVLAFLHWQLGVG